MNIFILAVQRQRVRYVLFSLQLLFAQYSPASTKLNAYAESYYRFFHLTSTNGLSNNTIQHIAQDSYGYIWFATQNGLNRYDGYNFITYRHEHGNLKSISHNTIAALLPSGNGGLWIGTKGGGLNYYDHVLNSFSHFRFDSTNTTSLSNDTVTALYLDRSGFLWIGTAYGLNRFHQKEKTFERFHLPQQNKAHKGDNSVTSLLEGRNGILWVGTLSGLLTFNHTNKSLTTLIGDSIALFNDGNIMIRHLAEDRNGNLWIGTQGAGLIRLSQTRNHIEHFLNIPADKKSLCNNYINSLFEDHLGLLWVGTEDGLAQLQSDTTFINFKHDQQDPNSLSGNSMLSLSEDASGILWIGTSFSGLNFLDRKQKQFNHLKIKSDEDLLLGWNNMLSAIEDRNGILWIGTFLGGVIRYEPARKRTTVFKNISGNPLSLSNDFVFSVYEDRSGDLWVGTQNGLNQYDQDSETFRYWMYQKTESNEIGGTNIFALHEDTKGNFWIGTENGLSLFDRTTHSTRRWRHNPNNNTSISNNLVQCIFEDSKGNLWIGTENGLNRFDRTTELFESFLSLANDPASLSHGTVYALYEDSQGRLWIGTKYGLNLFSYETKTFTAYLRSDGLLSNEIRGMLQDGDGYLWISSDSGMTKFHPDTKTFRHYNAIDGLQGNDFLPFSAHRLDNGMMYFGGTNGFNLFHPDSIRDNFFTPPIVITSIKKFDTELSREEFQPDTEELVLSHDDDVISFEFAALDFLAPSKNRYAYIMEGFDRQWQLSGSRRIATYMNLEPGEYLFRVRGTNRDGVWNETGTSLHIIVLPAWWATWWFRSLSILGFAGLLYSGIRYRVSIIEQKRKAQEVFSRQLIERQEAERKRIATDLHDSVSQHLLMIKNKLLITLHDVSNSSEELRHVKDAAEYATQAIKEIREISHNLRPSSLDQLGLTLSLESLAQKISDAVSLNCTVQIENIDGVISKENEINLFRIVQESLNNIIKHSEAKNLRFTIHRSVSEIIIAIDDDGKGIPSDILEASTMQKEHFGLTGMFERARILSGTLTITHRTEGGTSVNLIIPVTGANNEQ
ncbi:MAG: hypothetical protein HYZ34_03235 [Ignavibacteriae bacterium]|nr:hypothetical protein [Ignavibacteriota bacterium]